MVSAQEGNLLRVCFKEYVSYLEYTSSSSILQDVYYKDIVYLYTTGFSVHSTLIT